MEQNPTAFQHHYTLYSLLKTSVLIKKIQLRISHQFATNAAPLVSCMSVAVQVI
jgi:hypothetical protein